MTCAHFGRVQICTQVKASLSPFGHLAQVNASWVTSINLLLANEIDYSLPQNVFMRLASTCSKTCEFIWPPNTSFYASWTCVHLRLLARPFDQGLRFLLMHSLKHNQEEIVTWDRRKWSQDVVLIQWKPVSQPPRYHNSTLFWPEQKLIPSISYFKNPFNMATLLIHPMY